ncbi:MAG TPA: filamentous hemagglutinin N-terminal domain-containing protein, partial [Verrucomicrobiae bacterium]|nr:filamentous hemagglutinin N-terminal domain-containing protein [Verrucomicrobiae bacterium]
MALLLIVALEFAPIKIAIDGIATIRFGVNVAYAAPIVDPSAPIQFRPTITHTTGTDRPVPVVNITPPNAAGTSLNKFQQFNIDAVGLILNNSLNNGGSLLGGNVIANPNLNGRTASLIINEVTSSGGAFASALNGSLEVFGASAAVVIANPNGVSCASCSFINTPRITLTTGAPQFLSAPGGSPSSFDNATALAFDVRGGRVDISGNGIEGTVGRIDIIAETIGLDAAIRAGGQINVIAGRQTVAETTPGQGAIGSDYQISNNGAVNTAAAIGAPNGLAIDATNFGAMQGGQIKIIATTQGLGVKAAGALAANASELTISSNGDVTLGATYAKNDLTVTAANNLTVAGESLTEGNLSLTSGGDIAAAGGMASSGDASLMAQGRVTLNNPLNVGGRLTASGGQDVVIGSATTIDSATITSTNGAITLNGAMLSGGDLSATAKTNVIANAEIKSLNALTLTAQQGSITANNALSSSASMTLTANQSLTLSGVTTAGANATLSGVDITNAGAIAAGGALSLSGSGVVNAGDLTVTQSATIAGANITIGDALIGGNLAAQAIQNLTLSGPVTVRGDMTLSSNAFVNRNEARAGGDIQVTANAFDNQSGASLTASGAAVINAATGNNQGVVFGTNTTVLTTGALNNQNGQIYAANNLTVGGESLTEGNLSLTSGGDIAGASGMASSGDASIAAQGRIALSG